MAVLAWLMLVVQSVAAVPTMNMPVASHARPAHTQVATLGHNAHGCLMAVASTASSCCQHPAGGGDTAGHCTCTCTATCATAVLPRVALTLPPVGATVAYALPPHLPAPAGANALPLRPPAA